MAYGGNLVTPFTFLFSSSTSGWRFDYEKFFWLLVCLVVGGNASIANASLVSYWPLDAENIRSYLRYRAWQQWTFVGDGVSDRQ